jgi:predicted AAA+ superfamily ATPase
MDRQLREIVKKDLEKKIVLLSGPRQVGKTTLSKSLFSEFSYLNYDYIEHRSQILEKNWDRKTDLLVLDELHKLKNWKQWLKGVYDVEGIRPRLLVTGSTKLNTYRKVGDSLAGRFFSYRLHPLDFKELQDHFSVDVIQERLMSLGGFPEPFLSGEIDFARKWRRSHLDIILRQDLLDLNPIRDIQGIETLLGLLQTMVGSPISYDSLARNLGRDATTVKRWLNLLEELFIIFRVSPHSHNIARAILKSPKYYFFDTGHVKDEPGARFENMVALCLLKECQFLEDTKGLRVVLSYLRNKEGKEIDFMVAIEGKPKVMIEAKWSEQLPSSAFHYFRKYLPDCQMVQLVGKLKQDFMTPQGIEIRQAGKWLSGFGYLV